MEHEPLLFIKSPSYYLDIPKSLEEDDMEESTSVFVKDSYVNESKNVQIHEQSDEPINEYLLKQLQFLEKPFRQRVYQPLLVCLKDGRKLAGTASDVQNDSLLLTSVELQTQETIHIEDVQQILWRGKKLPI
ncbi:hypothetical protein AEA09_18580 [Lysinibacillus contaminans]|uniref:Spore coat protein n=1 Tax=Lysinibacillus contaminans TaxID=1293441 RepID=A0ABR5JX37_9BACI|nr:hypothetical protein [Lysinibacillus contaminans]KOS66735.1 hypothetical protein AEA09_18580 [Lysinibacillus contaminans]